MPNMINQAVAASYEGAFDSDLDTLILQPVGMSVDDSNAFRTKLSEANLCMTLLKGSLAKRAMQAGGFTDVDDLFVGPAAFVTPTSEDVEGVAITAARVVDAWLKESGGELPGVKGGFMEGEVLDSSQASALAKLPTKSDMQSILSGQILAPGRNLSSQFKSLGGKLASQIEKHIENLGGGGEG